MQTYGVDDPSRCVADETLFALARGELSDAALHDALGHLKDCADCRAVLTEAVRALAPAGSSSARPAEITPAQIGRYRIEALLGAGASGVVYRAFDPQLERAVALKVLRAELHGSSPGQSERLLREAQSMARLSDPHAVTIYDVGLHEGSVYLVMEYIDGPTLSAWLDAAPRTAAELVGVFLAAGRGLWAAHEKGLVHRDFKPENVLVARDGRAKVTDFGLARESQSWLERRKADDPASTALYAPTRGLVGTPAYMAPELFEGEPASPASDQFAFCVALFAALFRRHPFRAGEGVALDELVARVAAGTVDKPTFDSAVGERLFHVLRRGLSAAPAARFGDMQELLAALERAARPQQRALVLAVSAGLLLLAALALARGRGGAAPADAASRSTTAPFASLATASPAPPAPPDPEPARVVAGTSPSATFSSVPRPPRTPIAERQRPLKPAREVRYNDGLKEPF